MTDQNVMPAALLVGEKVRLVAVTPDDLPVLTRWYQDTHFLRLYDADPAYPRTGRQVADLVADDQRSNTAFVFAIRTLAADEMIGCADLNGIIWSQGVGWLSIGIGDPAHRGQGYGYDAMRLLLAFAFDELNLRRLQLTVFDYNPAAIRLYERLGFRREGVFREFLRRDGQIYDMLLYGLLRREWDAQTGNE